MRLLYIIVKTEALNMRTYLAVLLITAICLIYALLTALMPRDVFWITDGGNKFITMENIIRDRTDAISYPSASQSSKAFAV